MFDSLGFALPAAEAQPWSSYAPDGLLADMMSEAAGRSGWERIERIGAWERLIAWTQACQLLEIARFAAEATGPAPDDIDESVAAEVGLITRVASRTAHSRVDLAVTLLQRLPATLAARSAGTISLSSARAIADETVSLDSAGAAEAENRVLRRAGHQTPSQVRAAARRAVAAIDADAVRRRAEQARRERNVSLTSEPDGMATLSAYFPAHEAVAAYGMIDDHARRAGTATGGRTMDARRADALVDLILDRPATGTTPTTRPAPGTDSEHTAAPTRGPSGPSDQSGPASGESSPLSFGSQPPAHAGTPARCDCANRTARPGGIQVLVTVALPTLLGLDQQPAELAGYGPIPADLARELAAQGTWRRLLTDPASGALLDYGTTRYKPPPQLAAHITTRDQTCVYPGCRTRADRCDLDHRIPHNNRTADTGPTSTANLAALCRTHHRLKHQPGWTLTRQPDGTHTWHTPTHHRYHRPAHPLTDPERSPTAADAPAPF
jgi:Domain of unknown function (DUF222)